MAWNNWLTIYAALLSTVVAIVQIGNFLRDRSKLRIQTWWDSNDRPGAEDRHFIIQIINDGRRSAHITPPQIEVTQQRSNLSRISYHSPEEVGTDYNWLPLEHYEPYDAIELTETSSRLYRYEINSTDRILRIRVHDRVGRVRLNRRFFWSPVHRMVFYIKHALWHAGDDDIARMRNPQHPDKRRR
jgi:hypothetical protein